MRFHAFAVCLVIAVLTVAIPSDARAQGCDCPEAQMLEVMDFRIAERRAKLDFVQAGGLESSSGLSNDPGVLAQELREMRRTRDLLLRDLINCRMQCYGRESGLLTDGTAFTRASSRCTSCDAASTRLSEAEDGLNFAQGNYSRFHDANELDRYGNSDPSSHGRRTEILQQAEADMESVERVRETMRTAQLDSCARVNMTPPVDNPSSDPLFNTSYYDEDRYMNAWDLWANDLEFDAALDRVHAERRRNLDIDLWTFEDVIEHYGISRREWRDRVEARKQSLRAENADDSTSNYSSTSGYEFDEDDEELDERAFRIEHAALRRRLSLDNNRDPDSYWQFGSMLERVWTYGHQDALFRDRSETSLAGFMLAPLDDALDYLRSIGLDPGEVDVTIYGECLRHTHALDRFLTDTYYPTRGALQAARARVPGDGGALFEEMRELAAAVRSAVAERDAALAELVRCNANYCRPEPTDITEFVDEGDGEGLEDLLEEEEEAPYGGPDDGLDGDGPDLTAPGETEAPTETGMSDMPDLDEMRDRLAAQRGSALAARDRMNAAGMLRTPRFACDFEPGNVCDKLEGDRAAQCSRAMETWLAACRRTDAMMSSPSAAQCSARCVHQGETADLAVLLRSLALEVVAESDRDATEVNDAQRSEIEPRIASTEAEIEQLETEIAEARIHIYTNRDSGEIIQHNGPYFEPNPPLEYTGDMAAPLTEAQEERRYVLNARLASLREILDEIDANSPDPAAMEDWRRLAQYTWMGGEYNGLRSGGALTCEAEQIAPEVARCQAFCAAQDTGNPNGPAPHPLDICQPTSAHGMLNTPLSRTWLYPPGDPRREPGYGREN